MTQLIQLTTQASGGKPSGLKESWRLIVELTRFEMLVNLTKSRFGWVWWFLDPLIMLGIFTLFKVIVMGRDRYQPYVLFIGCALLCWKFFSTSLSRSTTLLRSRESLIMAFPFPTWVLPCSLVFQQLIFFTTALVPLTAISVFMGQPIGLKIIQMPPLILLCVLLTLGASFLFSTLGVFFSDLSQYMNHLIRIGWFLSPSMYSSDLVAQQFGDGSWQHRLFLLNPMALLFEGFRKVLWSPQWISPADWFTLGCISSVVLLLGAGVYRHYNRRLVKHF